MKTFALSALCLSLLLPMTCAPASAQDKDEPIYEGRTLDQWIAASKDQDAQVRTRAVNAVSQMGPLAKRAIPALKQLIKDTDPTIRQDAVSALGKFGSDALPVLLEMLDSEDNHSIAFRAFQEMGREAVPELLQDLRGKDVRRRRAVAAVLGQLARKSRQVTPALRQALRDPDLQVRLAAASSLRYIDFGSDQCFAVLLEALRDPDPAIRMRAVEQVWSLGREADDAIRIFLRKLAQEESGRLRIRVLGALWDVEGNEGAGQLPLLVEALKSKDEDVCQEAMLMLASLASGYKEVVGSALPAILALVKDRKQHRVETVRWALDAIVTVAPDPKEVLPVYLEAAQDSDPAIVELLVGGLPWLAPKDPAVPPLLISALHHKAPKVRIAAARAFGPQLIKAKEAIPGLIGALKHPHSAQLRWTAAASLAEQGPEARAAIPALLRALDDKDVNVRLNAAEALSRIDLREARAALPMLIRSLGSWDSGNPGAAMEVLRRFGAGGVTQLIRGLQHADQRYRLGAAFALGNFGVEAKPAAPALQTALKDKDSSVRITAALALTRLNVRGDDVSEALREGFASRDLSLRQQAIQAAARLGANGKDVVPALTRVLKDKDAPGLRQQAANALGRMGSVAAAAAPALMEVTQDGPPELRDAAIAALARIGVRDSTLGPIAIEAALTSQIEAALASGGSPNSHTIREMLQKAGTDAIPPLLKRLKDADPDVRAATAKLTPFGLARHQEVRESLVASLKDDVLRVRLAAASALWSVDRSSANRQRVLEVVKSAVQDKDAMVRMQATQTLQQMLDGPRGGQQTDVTSLLLGQLRDKSGMVRANAMRALASMQAPPKEAFSVVLAALKGRDAALRYPAVEAIQHFGPEAKEAIPALREILQTNKNEQLQDAVVRSLVRLGRDDQAVTDALVEVLKKSRNRQLRSTVLHVLAEFGNQAHEAVPAIVQAFNDEQLRPAAMQALTRIDPTNKLLPAALAEMLGKQEYHPVVRHRDRDNQNKPFGPEAAENLTALLLKDLDPGRRAGAAVALATLVRPLPGLSKPLRESLKDESMRVRLYAAGALWVHAEDGTAVLPIATAALKDKDRAIRVQAGSLLLSMGPAAKGAVADLAEALRDESVCSIAAEALRALGSDATPAVPALIEALKNDMPAHARREAVLTLSQCGQQVPEAVPELLKMLKQAEPSERATAAYALGRIGSIEQVLPSLLDVVRNSDEDEYGMLSRSVGDVLRQLGPDVCVPLAKLLKEKKPSVRKSTIEILESFGPKAVAVLPDLLASLEDKDEDVALRAATAVWHVDKCKEALPVFLRGLKSKVPDVRLRAVQGLGLMGNDAKVAVPELLAAYRDGDRLVRRAAYSALQQRAVYSALQQLDPATAANLSDPDQE